MSKHQKHKTKYGFGPLPFVDGVVSLRSLDSTLAGRETHSMELLRVRVVGVSNKKVKIKKKKKVRERKKTVARVILNGLVYILILGGIIVGLPRGLAYALNTPFPMAAITSGSMWPELKIGSLVFIEGIENPEDDLRLGDIIVFRNYTNNTFTIHRVVEMKKNSLTTKGDGNFDNDKPISYKDIVGRAWEPFGEKPFSIPYLGSITVFASNLE